MTTKKTYFQTFQDMVVWQQSFDFVKDVYSLLKDMSGFEKNTIASSFARSALSIPVNIAKGQKRRGADFVKYLNFAKSNAAECETYLLLVIDLLPEKSKEIKKMQETNAIIQRMLGALAYTLEHPKNKKEEKNQVVYEATKNSEVLVTV